MSCHSLGESFTVREHQTPQKEGFGQDRRRERRTARSLLLLDTRERRIVERA